MCCAMMLGSRDAAPPAAGAGRLQRRAPQGWRGLRKIRKTSRAGGLTFGVARARERFPLLVPAKPFRL